MRKGTPCWTPLVLTITLLGTAGSSLAAGLYKWTDSQGNVQYTQSPPPKGEFKELVAPKAPPAPPAAPATPEAGGNTPATAPKDKTAELEAERKKLEAEITRHNCEAARKNLDIYTVTRRIMNEKGEVETLDDDVRAARIKEANEQIKKNCK